MDRLSNRYEFGQDDDLRKPGGITFNVLRLEQNREGRASLRMDNYIRLKLGDIPIERGRKKQCSPPRAVGTAGAARHKGPTALLARKIMDARSEELIEASRIVTHCRRAVC